MSKDRATIGTDGLALPVLPPERDARVWARLVRVMFYLPGFMALLLIKAGEPTAFGITVELLMLSSAAAIIGGLYIGAESSGAGADPSSQVGTWSGALVLELLAVVPFCVPCRRSSMNWRTVGCCTTWRPALSLSRWVLPSCCRW